MIDRLPEKAEHVGVIVPDMDTTRKELQSIYGDLPGLDFTYVFTPDTVWTDGVKNEEKIQLKLCMVQLTDSFKVELIQPLTRGEYEHRMFLRDNKHGGMHHIAYYTKKHFSEYRQLLLDRGGRILFESETEDARGYRRCCYLQCPDSRLVIEIAEPPKPFPNQAPTGGLTTAVD